MALIDSLVSYWKCDEASGNLTDAHGSNTLTDTNTVTTAGGKINTARQYTRANSEYHTIADNTGLSTGDLDFSIQCGAYLDDKADNCALVTKWGAGGNREYQIVYNMSSDRFEFYVSDNGTNAAGVLANSLGSPSTATWYLIHAWHDSVSNLIGIAVNAGTADTTAHTTGVRDGNLSFRIGGRDDLGFYHNGRLDEIAFWKGKALSSAERTELYNSGAWLAYPFTTPGASIKPWRRRMPRAHLLVR